MAASARAPQARGDVVGIDRPLDRHQARRGDARARRRREHRGALEVEGQRVRRVRRACSTSAEASRPRAVAAQRGGERRVGLDALAGAQRPAGAVVCEHRAGRHELAGAQRGVERPRAADAHRAAQAQAPAARPTTMAALGPPMPVLWTVSGAPSSATPV